MARPKKSRVICTAPQHRSFAPMPQTEAETVCLETDEYEALRLHDLEHLSQEETAAQMLVSRPTVTMLLLSARQKVADVLVNGKLLEIADGNCRICEIGCACPKEKKDTCSKRARCAASCRHTSCQSKK